MSQNELNQSSNIPCINTNFINEFNDEDDEFSFNNINNIQGYGDKQKKLISYISSANCLFAPIHPKPNNQIKTVKNCSIDKCSIFINSFLNNEKNSLQEKYKEKKLWIEKNANISGNLGMMQNRIKKMAEENIICENQILKEKGQISGLKSKMTIEDSDFLSYMEFSNKKIAHINVDISNLENQFLALKNERDNSLAEFEELRTSQESFLHQSKKKTNILQLEFEKLVNEIEKEKERLRDEKFKRKSRMKLLRNHFLTFKKKIPLEIIK